MAKCIPQSGPMVPLAGQLTLATLQRCCGGFIEFKELRCGDVLVIHESQTGFFNTTASALAGFSVYGDAVLCSPEEIE